MKPHSKYQLAFSITVWILLFSTTPTDLLIAQTITPPVNIPELPSTQNLASISVSTSPLYPKAGQEVSFKATSYSVDLNRSVVRWYVSGKMEAEGAGLTTFKTTNGQSGTRKIIKVEVIGSDGNITTEEIILSAAEVSIVWQADTYTPPFYKGKRLYSHSADLLLLALPATSLSTSGLNYTWRQDGDIIENANGLGKNSLILQGSMVTRDKFISVIVSSFDGSFKAQHEISLKSITPKVLLYEDHPLYGVQYQYALRGGVNVSTDEVKLNAYPFHFSTRNRNLRDLTYSWKAGGADTANAAGGSSIILKRNPSVNNISISVEARHPSKLFQMAKATAQMNFINP